MKKYLLGTVAALSLSVFATSAHAADLMDMPTGFDWSGWYAGAFVGGGIGQNRFSERGVPVSTNSADLDGFLAGGTIGYNFNAGTNFVLGIEADLAASDISSLAPTSGGFNCLGAGCKTDVENLITGRVRLGYAMDASLLFVTGGVAVGDVTGSFPGVTPIVGTDTLVGWTVGAGFERFLASNLSAKIEYLYTDLGRLELPTNCGTDCYTDVDFHTVRVGINYLF